MDQRSIDPPWRPIIKTLHTTQNNHARTPARTFIPVRNAPNAGGSAIWSASVRSSRSSRAASAGTRARRRGSWRSASEMKGLVYTCFCFYVG